MRNTLKALLLTLGLSLCALPKAHAALPWGAAGNVTLANSIVSGATPTCTYSATLLTCIEVMTANVTSVTLAGMTAGTYYTLIFVQDGTGSRTLTQTPITAATGGLAVPAIPSTANTWTAWRIKATSATAATFDQNYDNVNLWDVYNMTQVTNGTTVANLGQQAQPTVEAPGVTLNNTCIATFAGATALPATWNGVVLSCQPQTNAVQVTEVNATNATITPTAANISIRILP